MLRLIMPEVITIPAPNTVKSIVLDIIKTLNINVLFMQYDPTHPFSDGTYDTADDTIRIKTLIMSHDINNVILHEIAHWTGKETRCKRFISGNIPNREERLLEEAIAEYTMYYLVLELGLNEAVARFELERYINMLHRNGEFNEDLAKTKAKEACSYILDLYTQNQQVAA